MTASAPPLRAGSQLASTVCTTRVVVVRAPAAGVELRCGGEPMVAASGPAAPAKPAGTPATQLGKRYVDANDTVELLCTSSGTGELSCDGVAMSIKAAKALPASD